MYFICHVTQQDHTLEISCVFLGESPSLHVTTMKILVTIGILIVKRKNALPNMLQIPTDTEKLS